MTVAFMGVWTRPVESRAMDWADSLLLSSFTLASKIPFHHLGYLDYTL